MSSNLLTARDPQNKIRNLRADADGQLYVSVSSKDGALATKASVDAVSTSVNGTTTAVNTLKNFVQEMSTSIESAPFLNTISSFTSKQSKILNDFDLDGGQASNVMDISGCAYVTIFYYDKMASGTLTKGLFVELSTVSSAMVTSSDWVSPEIQILPASCAGYPNVPSGATRKAFIGPLKVAGYKSLRLVHEDPASTESPGPNLFTDANALVVASSI